MQNKKEYLICFAYYSVRLLLCFVLFLLIIKYCQALVISLILIMTIKPLINKVNQRLHITNEFLRKIMSLIITILFFLMIIVGTLYIIYSISSLLVNMPDFIEHIYHQMNKAVIHIDQSFYQHIQSLISKMTSLFVGKVIELIMHLSSIIVEVGFIFILSLFGIVGFDDIENRFLKTVKGYHHYKSVYYRCFYQFIKAYFLLMMIVIILLAIGFMIIGLPHSILLAIIIGVIDFLPILGIDMIMIPWILFCLFTNELTLALSLLIIYLITILTKNIVEPQLLSQAFSIPPWLMIGVMYIMMKALGIIGMVISPFIAYLLAQKRFTYR